MCKQLQWIDFLKELAVEFLFELKIKQMIQQLWVVALPFSLRNICEYIRRNMSNVTSEFGPYSSRLTIPSNFQWRMVAMPFEKRFQAFCILILTFTKHDANMWLADQIIRHGRCLSSGYHDFDSKLQSYVIFSISPFIDWLGNWKYIMCKVQVKYHEWVTNYYPHRPFFSSYSWL